VTWPEKLHRLQLGDVGDVLTDLDRQIAELQQRVTAQLDSETT
jgi:hypothetical protein